jgi:hypothetical protein
MDDDENHELRQKLAHKPPGEPLSLAEIRELKKMETERVNRCIERGQRPEARGSVASVAAAFCRRTVSACWPIHGSLNVTGLPAACIGECRGHHPA